MEFSGVRVWRNDRDRTFSCCSTVSTDLTACLRRNQDSLPASAESRGIGILMMGSKNITDTYGKFAELSVRVWASLQGVDLIVAELDDSVMIPRTRAVYWQKLCFIRRYLEFFSHILYLDADAAVTDFQGDFHSRFAEKDIDLIVSRERQGPDELSTQTGLPINIEFPHTLINAGVLWLRNSLWTRQLLDDWWACGDEKIQYRWNKVHDQGCLGELMVSHVADTGWLAHVLILSPSEFNNHSPFPDSDTRHYFQRMAKLRQDDPENPRSRNFFWWCSQVAAPVVQFSGEPAAIRMRALEHLSTSICAGKDSSCLDSWPVR